jgi:hypothetical protein
MFATIVSYGCRKSSLKDVTYVAIVSEACCKRIFRVFQSYVLSMFSECMLQVCLSGCYICFTHILHLFYLDVASGCNVFQVF